MKSYGMDQKLMRLIKAIYGATQSAVLVNGQLNEWFQMTVIDGSIVTTIICCVPEENNG